MAMMRVMAATRIEREGRWPSEGSMRMGGWAFFDYTWKREKKDLTQRAQRKNTEVTEKSRENARTEPEGTIYRAPTWNQVRWSLRVVALSMRFRLGVKPMPGVAGAVMVPWGVTVTSGVMMSFSQ